MDTSRIWKALSLTTILFLLLGSGLGVASASSGDHVIIPMPAPGDSAQYVIKEIIDDRDIAKGRVEFNWARLSWQAETTIVDDSGASRLVRPAHFELMFKQGTQYELTLGRTTYYDAATGEPVADKLVRYGDYEAHQGVCLINGMCFGDYPASDYRASNVLFENALGNCGVMTSLHGAERLEDRVEVPGLCDDFRVMGDQTTSTYVLDDEHTWKGNRAVTYRATETGYGLTYAHGISIPVVIEVPLAEYIFEPYTLGRHFVLELRSYDAASELYPVREPAPANPPLPLVDRVETTHIDERGLVGFTLSEAFEAAIKDTANPRMAQFMARDGAYLGAAFMTNMKDNDGNEMQAWFLVATDGDRELTKIVQRDPSTGPVHDILLGADMAQYYVTDYDEDSGIDFPPSFALPSKIASLPAALALAPAFPGIAVPNTWGFYSECANRACTDAHFRVRVGDEVLPSGTFAFGLEGSPVAKQHTVFFDDDGRASHTWAFEGETGAAPVVPLLNENIAPASDRVSESRPGLWIAPTAAAAAGMGFLAIVIGALYYFWPAVKTMPVFSMFSRIQPDRVLENPNRAKLMGLIEAEPGVHFQELSRQMDLGRGALDHHLRKLSEAGLVVAKVAAGYTCFFPKGVGRHEMAAAGVIKSPGAQKVFQAVNKGRTSVQDIAASTGLSASTVSHHLSRMKKAGVVEGGGREGYKPIISS